MQSLNEGKNAIILEANVDKLTTNLFVIKISYDKKYLK